MVIKTEVGVADVAVAHNVLRGLEDLHSMKLHEKCSKTPSFSFC